MAIGVGTGTDITFATSTFTAEVLAVNQEEVSRPVIDSTHLKTTVNRSKIAGTLVDESQVSLELHFDPELIDEFTTLIAAAPESVTITLASTTPGADATIIGTGFVSAYSWGTPLEDKMVGTITWTWDGLTGPTYTKEAAA